MNPTDTLEQDLARSMVAIQLRYAAAGMEEALDKYGDVLPTHVKAAILDWAQAGHRLKSALEAE